MDGLLIALSFWGAVLIIGIAVKGLVVWWEDRER